MDSLDITLRRGRVATAEEQAKADRSRVRVSTRRPPQWEVEGQACYCTDMTECPYCGYLTYVTPSPDEPGIVLCGNCGGAMMA